MSIIVKETEGVKIRQEMYASDIRIKANPDDTLAGAVLIDMHLLEYQNDDLVYSTPSDTISESIADFVQRTFQIGDKTISGIEVMLLIKLYVRDLYNEHTSNS